MRRWILRLGLLGLLSAALAALMFQHVLVIRKIEVVGGGEIGEESVIHAAGLEPGQGMLRLNTEQVKNGISSLGTHALVAMERCWPDTVRLVLREREAAAMALCGGGMAVLDDEGVVIRLVQVAPDRDLIYLSGVHPETAAAGKMLTVTEDQLVQYRAMMEALKACDGTGFVSEFVMAAGDKYELILRNGTTVLLEKGRMLPEITAWMKAVAQDMEHRGEAGGRLYIAGSGHADLSLQRTVEER